MKVTLLIFKLEMEEPFAVAAPEAAQGGADKPIAHDPLNLTVAVPPSSLAGSLRNHITQEAPDLEKKLFGRRIGETESPADDEPLSSRLRILGTAATMDGRPLRLEDLTIRRQTAIDRTRGAADTHTLRSAQVAPAGTTIEMFARVDGELDETERETLASWQPVVGWGRTTGQGRGQLISATLGVLDLERPEDLKAWLTSGGPDLHRAVATQALSDAPPPPAPVPWRSYTLEIVDPLHIAGDRKDAAANTTQMLRRGDRPVVDGSTFKGIVRARAEYIADTMAGGPESPDTTGASTPSRPLINTLFGTPDKQGRLAFSSTTVENADVETRPHVAIDRLTGGARDRQLFNYEVAVKGRLRLQIHDLGDGPMPAGSEALLDAVVRDLHDGLLGIGGHTASGHGTVRLADNVPCPRPKWSELVAALAEEDAATEAAATERRA